MSQALQRLAQEDPSFQVRSDEEAGQTIISGMGELHLEILVERMKREFSVAANVGKPQVAYREAIKKQVTTEGKYIKQTGGRGQYGHVLMRLEPGEAGSGLEFVNEIKGGSIPREYIPAVQKGVADAMQQGSIAGYPVVDIKVTLYDGSFHEVDSSEQAFRMAGAQAFRDGIKKANPALLEPVMRVEVETPEEKMGDVDGRSQFPARNHPGHGRHLRRRQVGKRRRAAGDDVRIRDPAAIAHSGARHLLDGVCPLCGSSRQPGSRMSRPARPDSPLAGGGRQLELAAQAASRRRTDQKLAAMRPDD